MSQRTPSAFTHGPRDLDQILPQTCKFAEQLDNAVARSSDRAFHTLAVSVIMVVLSLFFLSLAQDMVAWSIKRPQTTAALGLPLMLPQSAIVLAAVLCSVYALRDFIHAVRLVCVRSPSREG